MEDFWSDYRTLVPRFIWHKITNKGSFNPAGIFTSKDSTGDVPTRIFMVSPGRGPGKTYGVAYKLLRDLFDSDMECKFGLIVRTRDDIGNAAPGIFFNVLMHHWPGVLISEVDRSGIGYVFIKRPEDKQKILAGFTLALNVPDKIKRASNELGQIYQCLFDEFVPLRSSDYVTREIEVFNQLVGSLGRHANIPDGRHEVPVPIYFCGNSIDIFNPYFKYYGISTAIQSSTKRARGREWVFERVEKKNPDGTVVSVDGHDNSWINDNEQSVDANVLKNYQYIYISTVRDYDNTYGLYVIPGTGCWYFSHHVDPSCKTITRLDHSRNSICPLLKKSPWYKSIKKALYDGQVWFSSQQIKRDLMDKLL